MKRYAMFWMAALAAAWVIGGASCDDINVGSDDSAKLRSGNEEAIEEVEQGGTTGDLTWNNFGENFVDRYCVSCHGSVEIEDVPFALETYEDVLAQSIQAGAEVESGGMPEEYPVPDSGEIQTLRAWANADAPQSGWTEVSAILNKYCVMCHNSPTREDAEGDYTSYEEAADDAEDLAEKIEEGEMPPNTPMPSDEDRQNFVQWVADGAPEN